MNETITRKSFRVKVCPQCNRAHEKVKDHYTHIEHTPYHEEFPRIRLAKQVCLECQRDKNRTEVGEDNES